MATCQFDDLKPASDGKVKHEYEDNNYSVELSWL